MFHALLSRVDTKKLRDIQSYQYSEKLILSDIVPAGQNHTAFVSLSNLGDFFCQVITGHYATLQSVAGPFIVDDGISHLRGLLSDQAGQKKLFNDYIPLDLWLSPGRVKNINATNNLAAANGANQASPSNQLFIPVEFEYVFSANSGIQLDCINDSNADIQYEICFHGIRVLSSVSNPDVSPLS